MTLDKATRQAIQNTIHRSIMEAMEVYNEKWLSASELCAEIGFFTPQWMKDYGSALPRTPAIVIDKNGEEHISHYRYPKHRILRMIESGEVLTLKVQDAKSLLMAM